MIVLLSPAKKIDSMEVPSNLPKTTPRLLEKTKQLLEVTANLSRSDLRNLMRLSDTLADLNYQRFQSLSQYPSQEDTKQTILTFTGDVYIGLEAKTLKETELNWAQNHIRILSGLYGLLRPLDGIYPYRLEMGTRLKTSKGHTLYDFWGSSLTEALNEDMRSTQSKIIINLASNEYLKAIKLKSLSCPIVHCHFHEVKNGESRPVMLYTKRARGMMARWIIDRQAETLEALEKFDYGGYRYNAKASHGSVLRFDRPHPKA